MRLVLVRHGQTPSNVLGLLDTEPPGPGLTDLGERQADAAAAALDGRPVDAIGISTLLRTAATAAPLAARRGLEPVVVAGLDEIAAADLEDRSDPASVRVFLDTAFAWARGDVARRMPGATTDGADFLDRYDAAVATLAGLGGDVVAFSHGMAIRTWTAARVRGVDRSHLEEQSFPNTSTAEIEGSPETGWDLVRWSAEPAGGVGVLAAALSDDPTGLAKPARGGLPR